MKKVIFLMIIVCNLFGQVVSASSVTDKPAIKQTIQNVGDKTKAIISKTTEVIVEATGKLVKFSDIKGHWAESVIVSAVQKGRMNGYADGTFKPDSIVTADQFLVMMLNSYSVTYEGYRVLDPVFLAYLDEWKPLAPGAISNAAYKTNFSFTPAKTGYWAKPYVDIAYAMGYLNTNNVIFPKNYSKWKVNLTRERAAYLLSIWYRTYEFDNPGSYIDAVEQSNFIKDMKSANVDFMRHAVSVTAIAGLMRGNSQGYFYPQKYLTRGEAAAIIERLRATDKRTPYKLDLSNKMYTEYDNGHIAIFLTKERFEKYNLVLQMAQKYVKTGYIEKADLGVGIYSSKQESLNHTRDLKTAVYGGNNRPEFTFAVGDEGTTFTTIGYEYKTELKYSKELMDAVIENWVGQEYADEFKKKLSVLESDQTSGGINGTYFNFQGKKFNFSRTTGIAVVNHYYGG